MSRRGGASLVELSCALALLGLVAALVLPELGELRRSAATAAAAHHLATTLQAMRFGAVASGRAQGLLFARDAGGWSWRQVRDGNGNGLRRVEVEAEIDRTLSGPHRLAEVVPGVRFGFPPGGPFPKIPPGRGRLWPADGPVRFGNADLVSFGPLGGSSSGSFYLTDGRRRLWAVVLYGGTARISVWRFDPKRGRWTGGPP
jgi:type II secretory pathway pseudopilin PulG